MSEQNEDLEVRTNNFENISVSAKILCVSVSKGQEYQDKPVWEVTGYSRDSDGKRVFFQEFFHRFHKKNKIPVGTHGYVYVGDRLITSVEVAKPTVENPKIQFRSSVPDSWYMNDNYLQQIGEN